MTAVADCQRGPGTGVGSRAVGDQGGLPTGIGNSLFALSGKDATSADQTRPHLRHFTGTTVKLLANSRASSWRHSGQDTAMIVLDTGVSSRVRLSHRLKCVASASTSFDRSSRSSTSGFARLRFRTASHGSRRDPQIRTRSSTRSRPPLADVAASTVKRGSYSFATARLIVRTSWMESGVLKPCPRGCRRPGG